MSIWQCYCVQCVTINVNSAGHHGFSSYYFLLFVFKDHLDNLRLQLRWVLKSLHYHLISPFVVVSQLLDVTWPMSVIAIYFSGLKGHEDLSFCYIIIIFRYCTCIHIYNWDCMVYCVNSGMLAVIDLVPALVVTW